MELLNPQKMAQLSREIGAENIPILLDIFLNELHTYQVTLELYQGQERLDYLLEISHALKSSAASFAADKLCSVAEKIDAYGKQDDFESVTQCLLEMQEALDITYQTFREFDPAA